MNKRSRYSKHPNEPKLNNGKSKRRSSVKHSFVIDEWSNNRNRDEHNNLSENHDMTEMEQYPSMFWHSQTGIPQSIHNGQRLFQAVSDPSVCGYSPVPLAYTMEPVSLPPTYHLYQPVIRTNYKTYRGRTKTHLLHNQNSPCNDFIKNGYINFQENNLSNQNSDYTSLPPTANLNDRENDEELSSEHRRYSDPGLGPASIHSDEQSEDSESAESGSSITTIGRSNKLILTFIEQMTKIKETNSQLFKELQQTKSELQLLKTELNHFKQSVPLDYQPGMLSEIIKEIRDANKVKEETMISKVKLMIENQESEKLQDLAQLKSQLSAVIKEKEENNERILKLEQEVASLKLSLSNDNREIAAFEEENLALRREIQEARASRNLAECHATKCVNTAITHIDPSNIFEPSCITSTPLRATANLSLKSTNSNSSTNISSLSSNDDCDDKQVEEYANIKEFGPNKNNNGSIKSLLFANSNKEKNSPPVENAKEATCEDFGSINDIPDVIVISGKSKELRTQTSRVLTAPSRATYTTAYI